MIILQLQFKEDMEEFIETQSTRPKTLMKKHEFNYFILALSEERNEMHHSITSLLLRMLLGSEVYRRLEFRSGLELRRLLKDIFSLISFDQMVNLFRQKGRYDICNRMIQLKFSNVQVSPGPVEMPHSRKLNMFYLYLKTLADDAGFKNFRETVQQRINLLNREVANASDSHVQFKFQKQIVLSVLLLQQISSTAGENAVLDLVLMNVPANTERRPLDIIANSKRAIIAAEENSFEEAEVLLKRAQSEDLHICLCFSKLCLLHDILYVYRKIFIAHPSRDNLDRVIIWGHFAMSSVVDEPEHVQVLWKRLFLQYMYLSLLRIKGDLSVKDSDIVDEDDIRQAKLAFLEYDRLFDSIPARRKMILNLAKARCFELEHNIKIAEIYCRLAIREINDGTYFEIEKSNILDYHQRLLRLLDNPGQ